MNSIKEAFIKLALEAGVLKFGTFTLKSGRISPYFFNAGLFYQGQSLKEVGEFYAHLLLENQVEFAHLFGPAYKGFTLASATAIALAHQGINKTLTFNRKEAKTHGEGGQLIGAPLRGKTVIIDDVITAGTAFREARAIIEAEGAQVEAVLIALDRCERGLTSQSTLAEIQAEGIAVYSIINVFDLIEYLEKTGSITEAKRLREYQSGQK